MEPTRHDKNTLDLILSNNLDNIHEISVLKTEMSDHDFVNCTILHPEFLKSPVQQPSFIPESPMANLNFSKADWDSIRKHLQLADWSAVIDPLIDQNTAWDRFEATVLHACECNAPFHTKSIEATNSVRIPKSRQILLKKKHRLNTRINAVKKYLDPATDQSKVLLSTLNKKRAFIEMQIKKDIQNQRSVEEAKVIEKIKTNPKAFYAFAKRSYEYRSPVGPLKDCNGVLQSDPQIMASILQKQYSSAFSDPEKANLQQFDGDIYTDPPKDIITDIDFSVDDIISAIDKLKISTAGGPDMFPAVILKECKYELAPIMYILWRSSLDSGVISVRFLMQAIIPIFKTASRADAVNYRPVSLTSLLIKVFERVVRAPLIDFIERNHLLNPGQHGFRNGHSCLTQLLEHIDNIINDLSSDSNADVIYLDFSKAFDKVDHRILLCKLYRFGIRGKLLTWITSFLKGRTQFVIINGHKSHPILVVSGVPQGTVLGTLLFFLYINDIFDVVKNSAIRVFADDSKIHKLIRTLLDRILLEEDFDAVMKWSVDNNMSLNHSKFMLLQHGKNESFKFPYVLHNGTIFLCGRDSVKDLGVHVDGDINWKVHIATKNTEANNKAAWILRTFSARDSPTMLLLFKIYVRFIVEYCCPLWSPHTIGDIAKLESIQRSFTSKIDGMRGLNYWDRLRKLGLYSLQRRRERYSIILIWKIQHCLMPNFCNIKFNTSIRRGATCIRQLGQSKYSSINTLVFHSFSSRGPALYNRVPLYVKEASTLLLFKSKLDNWLKSFPDTPPSPGYTAANNNSLMEWTNSGRC